MKYFIDGNNLGLFLFKENKNEDIRMKVLNFLLSKKIPKNAIVVFDGFSFCSETAKGQLSVIFSKNRKADEVIAEKIAKGDTVVTNDRELQYKCKIKGAGICDAQSFISRTKSKLTKDEKPLFESDIEGWMKKFSEERDER